MLVKFLRRHNVNPVNVVFAGDSLTYNDMYPSDLIQMLYHYPGPLKTNLGYNGENSTQMLGRINQAIAAYNESTSRNVLIYCIGTNDANANPMDLAGFISNITSYYTQAKEYFSVICVGLTDLSGNPREYNGPVINEWLRTYWPQVSDEYVDLIRDSRLQDSSDTDYFNVDGVHYNSVGAQIVASLVYKKILKFL